MKGKFKKGQWLIRKWKKEDGGEVDLVRFFKNYDVVQIVSSRFSYSNFYRFIDEKLIYIICKEEKEEEEEEHRCEIDYKDNRMTFQFRVATKSEISKYAKILFNSTGLELNNNYEKIWKPGKPKST